MSQRGAFGPPPTIEVDVLQDLGASGPGFLRVRHMKLRNRYDASCSPVLAGQASKPYDYFMVERDLLDAVAIVLFRRVPVAQPAPGQVAHVANAREPNPGELRNVEVLLRSQLRPPLAFRDRYFVPLPALGTGAVQWEVPAGLVELGEHGEAGLFKRAAAEALEEAGYALEPCRFRLLGRASSLSPGLIAEKLHFVCAELEADEPCQEALGDGHAVEEGSVSVFVPLSEALAAIASGLIHDVKTEVALHRLAQLVGVR